MIHFPAPAGIAKIIGYLDKQKVWELNFKEILGTVTDNYVDYSVNLRGSF